MEVTERILVETGQLFGKFGIRSMTMDMLAVEMGISKRTIYEHFRDKDTLLLEVIRYYQENDNQVAHDLIDQSENAIEALFRIMKILIERMKRINPLFFHDLKKYHSEIYGMLSEEGEMRDYSVTLNLLETGIKQKVFREDTHIDIVNRTLHELFNLFSPDSSLTRADYHRKEMFDHIIIPYFRGISTAKGMALLEEYKNLLE